MCYNPRDLYVFYPPTLPIWLTDQEIEQYTFPESTKSLPLKEVSKDKCIVANACNYTKATDGVIVIQSLGHSMNAVSLPKGKTITFDLKVHGKERLFCVQPSSRHSRTIKEIFALVSA